MYGENMERVRTVCIWVLVLVNPGDWCWCRITRGSHHSVLVIV